MYMYMCMCMYECVHVCVCVFMQVLVMANRFVLQSEIRYTILICKSYSRIYLVRWNRKKKEKKRMNERR
jgi:hypothetical protein